LAIAVPGQTVEIGRDRREIDAGEVLFLWVDYSLDPEVLGF
jgi:hypothetical protein